MSNAMLAHATRRSVTTARQLSKGGTCEIAHNPDSRISAWPDTAIAARFHGTPIDFDDPCAPTLGQHTDEVVAETGRGDRLAELREAGVVG